MNRQRRGCEGVCFCFSFLAYTRRCLQSIAQRWDLIPPAFVFHFVAAIIVVDGGDPSVNVSVVVQYNVLDVAGF